jgi:phosphohistidine phosphatase SixA
MLYLVRHAKAGSRHDFSGDDRLRPLNASGRRQAGLLAERFSALAVTTLISSPYVRCIQTLQPTATAFDAKVETDVCLGEGRSFVGVLDLMSTLPDASVVCSHGDVIPETIGALERRGCEFLSAPQWRKGSVWVLERDARGEFVTAEAWPPPDGSS